MPPAGGPAASGQGPDAARPSTCQVAKLESPGRARAGGPSPRLKMLHRVPSEPYLELRKGNFKLAAWQLCKFKPEPGPGTSSLNLNLLRDNAASLVQVPSSTRNRREPLASLRLSLWHCGPAPRPGLTVLRLRAHRDRH